MKILIIGKNSRITQFLKDYLNRRFFLSIKSYSEVVKKESNYFNKFDFVINCSSNKRYVNLKYNSLYDHDYQIVKKLIKLKPSYIFLSTRKIYKPNDNCNETNKPKPQCNYSKNKLITEEIILKIPLITGRVIIKIIKIIMMVRRINKINWSSFSLRIDSRSNSFRNRRVLKSIVITCLRFNKCIIKGIAVK